MEGRKLKPLEERKYKIIKKLIRENGNKTRASLILGVTKRTVNRLIKQCEKDGYFGFIHKNTGRVPRHAKTKEFKEKIISLYKTKYFDTNFNHFKELLLRNEKIKLSYGFIYKLLSSVLLLSPKPYKRTKTKVHKLLKTKLDQGKHLSEKEKTLINSTNILNPKEAHARLPRPKYFGESIQMDASCDYWINNKKCFLHGAIDSSTGMILGLYFDYEETLNGYYNVLRQILLKYGIPYEFITDKRTIFVYECKDTKQLENDTHTQFGYACKQLGINIVTTSVAQKKGRIERLWETLQGRLIPELRLALVKTLKEANKFLEHYMDLYNNTFALPIDYTRSIIEKIDKDTIDNYLSVITKRVIDRGGSIKYQNKYYQPYLDGRLINFVYKTECLIIKRFNGELVCNINDVIYNLIKVPTHKKYSSNFDATAPQKPQNQSNIKICDPWKKDHFMDYLKKMCKDEDEYYEKYFWDKVS